MFGGEAPQINEGERVSDSQRSGLKDPSLSLMTEPQVPSHVTMSKPLLSASVATLVKWG